MQELLNAQQGSMLEAVLESIMLLLGVQVLRIGFSIFQPSATSQILSRLLLGKV